MIRLDTVDSTNNYAMQAIDAATADHGDIVLAAQQTGGKGQRGKVWYDTPGESLLMSLVIRPGIALDMQPAFLATTVVAIADALGQYLPFGRPCIKWPNDLLIGDKKAGGILIENVVRSAQWDWAVIGIGINVGQLAFPDGLPHATSLTMAGATVPAIDTIAIEIADAVVQVCAALPEQNADDIFDTYNNYLYQRDKLQAFRWGYDVIVRRVLDVAPSGKLRVRNQDGAVEELSHGTVEWIWR